ncbi:MAG: fatty acid CoA ligase family protein [Actinomycetota bacterium]|nr:fatty acid CoA ligase family protein [Actinomycetota bacterium]
MSGGAPAPEAARGQEDEPATLDGMLAAAAAADPGRPATILPRGQAFHATSFAELDRRVNAIAAGLLEVGIGAGMRTVLMVPPTEDFFALTFALLRLRAVPVLIDPGIGRQHLKACLAEAAPGGFIGVRKAHAARQSLRWSPTAKVHVTVGLPVPGGGRTLRTLERLGADRPATVPPRWDPTATAAIAFTSGSTGRPKGVEYQDQHFVAQVELLRTLYDIEPGEVSVATFPPFALFGPALGISTVIPLMDPTRPAQVDPTRVAEAVVRNNASLIFGSPALLDTVSRWGEVTRAHLPTVTRVISAGAPVPRSVQRRVLGMLRDGAQVHTPYGATEALPVTTIGSAELLNLPERGICVGRPVPGVDLTLIRVTDEPLDRLTDDLLVAPGEVGEIVVRGPNVTSAYADRPAATKAAKLDWDGSVAHRMGDLGVMDGEGRLWFYGRKVHRVQCMAAGGPLTLYSVPVEEVYNAHPSVRRCALVGIGPPPSQEPVLVVELEPGMSGSDELTAELLAMGTADPSCARIETVRYSPGLPVDIRHNSKIDREALAGWVEKSR